MKNNSNIKEDLKIDIKNLSALEDSDKIFRILNNRHNYIYNFVILYYDYIISKHDYGTGDEISMIEAHTITFIDEHPKTTVTELSKYWNKTKGAISQTISRLIKKGYVEKKVSPENKKIYNLYVTQKGKELSSKHKLYDNLDIIKTMNQLLESVTQEELDSFFKVLKFYIPLLKNNFE